MHFGTVEKLLKSHSLWNVNPCLLRKRKIFLQNTTKHAWFVNKLKLKEENVFEALKNWWAATLNVEILCVLGKSLFKRNVAVYVCFTSVKYFKLFAKVYRIISSAANLCWFEFLRNSRSAASRSNKLVLFDFSEKLLITELGKRPQRKNGVTK